MWNHKAIRHSALLFLTMIFWSLQSYTGTHLDGRDHSTHYIGNLLLPIPALPQVPWQCLAHQGQLFNVAKYAWGFHYPYFYQREFHINKGIRNCCFTKTAPSSTIFSIYHSSHSIIILKMQDHRGEILIHSFK